MAQPTLSVLVVTHNKPHLCAQFLLSIALAKDTPKDTEYLIYQSGICEYKGKTEHYVRGILSPDARIIVIEDRLNLGISVGFNSLIQLARGKYLFLANDDMIMNQNGWFQPLVAELEKPGVGMVCSTIDNNDYRYSLDPDPWGNAVRWHINDFSNRCDNIHMQPTTLVESESNQPWLVRKSDLWKFNAQDPIINQHKWICEWTDPTGCGWHCDWACCHKIHLAGMKTGAVPQSMVYHYNHATLKDKDKNNPGWTRPSTERYQFLWGTDQKQLPQPFYPKRFLLGDGRVDQI